MSAGGLLGSGSLLSAADFFGKTDVGGVEKFKAIAFRALHEQKLEEELQETKQENEKLKDVNARVMRDLDELQTAFDANIDDRERVLAFKSKRIEELHVKLSECEAINASFVQAITEGSSEGYSSTSTLQSTSVMINTPTVRPVVSETHTRARMMTLVNAGKPLFHALDTCKEQEYKHLYEDSHRQCKELTQTAHENEAAMHEARLAKFRKQESDSQIEQLQAQLAAMTLEKDELGLHLERKLLLEHDKLRREKATELEALQESMRTQMRMQLDMTTQRTVEENERVQLELRYQSSHLEKMMKQIDTFEAENKRLKQEMQLFEEMNAELSKKLKFYEHLFAKMQRNNEQRPKQVDNEQQQIVQPPGGPPSSRRAPRKPPLPAMPSGNQTKTTLPETPPLSSMGSSHGSFFLPDVDSFQIFRSSPIDDSQSPYQLNAITDVLEKHLQSREFTKAQVVAALRYHHDQYRRRDSPKVARDTMRLGSTPESKKKLMLSKACYQPSRRRMREPPMTLDALIKQKLLLTSSGAESNNSTNLAIDEEQRQLLHNLLLPKLSGKKRNDKPLRSLMMDDVSDMWKRSGKRLQSERREYSPPETARF